MKFKVFLIALLTTSCSSYMPTATVKITNLAGNSGGSGTVIKSSPTYSEVLTNSHVCEVVENGGIVMKDDGQPHFVTSYRRSQIHDLCLISVSSDLKDSTSLAYLPPRMYETALVSGHPRLLPTIISEGKFSSKQIIPVLTGYRDCKPEDLQDESTALFCMVLGKMPVVTVYEAIVVSSLIQPGSSGSAVYNEHGSISAVVFAGSQDIGYGYAVPYEYVYTFLKIEASRITAVAPSFSISLVNRSKESKRNLNQKVAKVCDALKQNKKNNKICNLLDSASQYTDLIQR